MSELRLQDYVTKIKNLIQNQRPDEAIAHCQHILRHHPKHIETYCLLGEACLEKGAFGEAIEFFQRTLSADPENVIARVGLGIVYNQQRVLPQAIWQMERAFELAPGNAEVLPILQQARVRIAREMRDAAGRPRDQPPRKRRPISPPRVRTTHLGCRRDQSVRTRFVRPGTSITLPAMQAR